MSAHRTVELSIPYTDAETYAQIKAAVFAWRERHLQAIALAWSTFTTTAQGTGNPRHRLHVVILQVEPAALSDLPEGVIAEQIPPLQPRWGVAARTPPTSPDARGGIVIGTKHFAPSTEVYCHGAFSGDGYERIYVTGRHKESGHFITIMQPTKRLLDWRVVFIDNPIVLFELREYDRGWENHGRDVAEALVAEMQRRTSLRNRAATPMDEAVH